MRINFHQSDVVQAPILQLEDTLYEFGRHQGEPQLNMLGVIDICRRVGHVALRSMTAAICIMIFVKIILIWPVAFCVA